MIMLGLYLRLGPAGTAICVYPDNVVNINNPTGFNEGLFSIFLEDTEVPNDSTQTMQNVYFEVIKRFFLTN